MHLIESTSPIYVIDDDPAHLMIMEVVLEKSDLSNPACFLSSGKEALKKLMLVKKREADFPALMLLDINMPQLSGFDVLKSVRDQDEFRDVPVIMMLTSSDAEKDKARASELGANAYLEKQTVISAYVERLNAEFQNAP